MQGPPNGEVAVSRKSASEPVVSSRHVEVAADDDGGIGVREQLRTGQQVVGGGHEGLLVGAAVDVQPHELFGAE